MKEDTQLICPISYEDPDNVWVQIQQTIVSTLLPLKDVTWKNPVSASFITIPKLPLKFLPSNANLFKDTDHPFRWFLAPYVHLYVTSVGSIEEYKNTTKQTLKQWVEFHGGIKRAYWIIIYAPKSNVSIDVQTKLFNKISSDFYIERISDRSIMIPVNTVDPKSAMSLNQQRLYPYQELLSKMREGIILLFQKRIGLYDSDIRRLDSFRGTAQLEFRQLFLVKESLALMYQMMQLPSEALIQYEELEALLSFAPSGILPEAEWPWVFIESSSATTKTASNNASTQVITSTIKEKDDAWINCCRNGDDTLNYSMNSSRTRILKNKVSLWELHRYVFARQVYLLLKLNKTYECCVKGYNFITTMKSLIDRKLAEEPEDQSLLQFRDNSQNKEFINAQNLLKSKQSDLWAISSSVKITRSFLDAINRNNNLEKSDSSNTVGTRSSIALNSNLNDSKDDSSSILCLHVLSDLLRYSYTKLLNLLGSGIHMPDSVHVDGTKSNMISEMSSWNNTTGIIQNDISANSSIFQFRSQSMNMANSLQNWLSYDVNAVMRCSSIANSDILNNFANQPDDNNIGVSIEEMLAFVSRRLRGLATFELQKNAVSNANSNRKSRTPRSSLSSAIKPISTSIGADSFNSGADNNVKNDTAKSNDTEPATSAINNSSYSPLPGAASPWMDLSQNNSVQNIQALKSISNPINSSSMNTPNSINQSPNVALKIDVNKDEPLTENSTYYSPMSEGNNSSVTAAHSLPLNISGYQNENYVIAIELGYVISEMDSICGREKISRQEKLQCGDMLLSMFGNIPRAMEFYCYTLDATCQRVITSTIATVVNSVSSSSANKTNRNSGGREYKDSKDNKEIHKDSNDNSKGSKENKENKDALQSVMNTTSLRNQPRYSPDTKLLTIPLRWGYNADINAKLVHLALSSCNSNNGNHYLYNHVFGDAKASNYTDSRFSTFSNSNINSEWNELKYWTLRKMLLCSRMLNDKVSYVMIALELIKPQYRLRYRLGSQYHNITDSNLSKPEVSSVDVANSIERHASDSIDDVQLVSLVRDIELFTHTSSLELNDPTLEYKNEDQIIKSENNESIVHAAADVNSSSSNKGDQVLTVPLSFYFAISVKYSQSNQCENVKYSNTDLSSSNATNIQLLEETYLLSSEGDSSRSVDSAADVNEVVSVLVAPYCIATTTQSFDTHDEVSALVLQVQVYSSLQCDLHADFISLKYHLISDSYSTVQAPNSAELSSGVSAVTDAVVRVHSINNRALQSEDMLECRVVSTPSHRLVIKPGLQSFPIVVTPKRTGDFCLVETMIGVGDSGHVNQFSLSPHIQMDPKSLNLKNDSESITKGNLDIPSNKSSSISEDQNQNTFIDNDAVSSEVKHIYILFTEVKPPLELSIASAQSINTSGTAGMELVQGTGLSTATVAKPGQRDILLRVTPYQEYINDVCYNTNEGVTNPNGAILVVGKYLKKLLSTLLVLPPFTPWGQQDLFSVKIRTGPHDKLSRLRLSVAGNIIVQGSNTMIPNKSKISSDISNIDEVTSRSEPLISVFPSSTWQIASISNTASYDAIVSDAYNISENESVLTFVGSIDESVDVDILIPYKTTKSADLSEKLYPMEIICHFSGDLIRNGCKIPINIIQKVVSRSVDGPITETDYNDDIMDAYLTGDGFEISSQTAAFHHDISTGDIEIYCQYTVRNITQIPIDLFGYNINLLSLADADNNREPFDHNELEKNSNRTSVVISESLSSLTKIETRGNGEGTSISTSSVVSLEPGTEYHGHVKFIFLANEVPSKSVDNVDDSVLRELRYAAKHSLMNWYYCRHPLTESSLSSDAVDSSALGTKTLSDIRYFTQSCNVIDLSGYFLDVDDISNNTMTLIKQFEVELKGEIITHHHAMNNGHKDNSFNDTIRFDYDDMASYPQYPLAELIVVKYHLHFHNNNNNQRDSNAMLNVITQPSDSECWICVGHHKQKLIHSIKPVNRQHRGLNTDSQVLSSTQSIVGDISSSVYAFEFEVSFLPVRVGVLSLPSIDIVYWLSNEDENASCDVNHEKKREVLTVQPIAGHILIVSQGYSHTQASYDNISRNDVFEVNTYLGFHS